MLHVNKLAIVATMQSTAVPKNVPRNSGLITTTLIDCIAAMPGAAGRRARALITQAEKAKKNPLISPQPRAETNVSTNSRRSIIASAPASEGSVQAKIIQRVNGLSAEPKSH
jgi:hypothetical protein